MTLTRSASSLVQSGAVEPHSLSMPVATLRATDRLLTPAQVAKILNVREATLANWRCTGRQKLPYLRFCGRIRYRIEDIQTFIEQSLHDVQGA